MSETTANLWVLDETSAVRRTVKPLTIGLLIGALLGSALTAVATVSVRVALAEKTAVAAQEWPKHALDREWRGYKTPVDPNRMFRKRR